jgi:two-component system response regulator QseB
MTTDPRPSALLVEDDPVLGPLITELLESNYAVRLVSDGETALDVATRQRWDVMVLDRGLPGMDGIALVTALRAYGIRTPVLILTAFGATEEKVRGLDAGANDYLTKPFDAAELEARLRALTRSYSPTGPVLSIGDWELNTTTRTARSLYGTLVTLTAKENELLSALASEPGTVFSRSDLIRRVFTPGDQPSIIDTYVHHLRRKTSPNVIRTVHGVGYQIGDGHE